MRKAALGLIDSLGAGGLLFLSLLKDRAVTEDDPAVADLRAQEISRLEEMAAKAEAPALDQPAAAGTETAQTIVTAPTSP